MDSLHRLISLLALTYIDTALGAKIGLWAESFATEDHKEGISSFIEKHKPEFKGK